MSKVTNCAGGGSGGSGGSGGGGGGGSSGGGGELKRVFARTAAALPLRV